MGRPVRAGWDDRGNGLVRAPNGTMYRESPPPMPEGHRLRIIVTGGRDFTPCHPVDRALWHLHWHRCITTLVHGGCPTGVDHFADAWARSWQIPVEVFPAQWDALGRAAGPVRNGEMVAAGADGVVAFPGGRGTADCVRQAEAAGIRVWRPFAASSP